MSLPTFHSQIKEFLLMQTQWGSQLNPILANPLMSGQVLSNVTLSAGDNTINHKLGRKLVGWFLVGIDAASTIYDKQSSNQMTSLTLILNSSAPCTASLYVF